MYMGDKVLINPHSLDLVDVKGTGWKLLQQRMGPFLITKKISLVVYCLCLPGKLQMYLVINIEHLTQYNQDEVSQQMKLKDLWMLKGEVKYEVNKILGHQFNQSQKCMEYLVRWKGYGPEHNMFELETHLRNAFSRLRSYKSSLLAWIL